ncbi:MAG: protein serine/threonine phosphatase [Blastococcus sp.]|nr:protein serine/threonine phosphatase [Blastococcus sp.]
MARRNGGAREDEERSGLQAAYEHTGLSVEQLWMRYFALGGDADLVDVDAHVSGLLTLPPSQHDMLAHAINERLDEVVAQHRVPYSRPVRQRLPTTGPLAALLGLLAGAGSAPPETLPSLAADAGRALGLQVAVYLVDQEQLRLVRMPTPGSPGGARLSVDGTLAGRAFRTVQILSTDRGDRPRLWVPLLDGADRLGVLEIELASPGDLHDPAVREHCRWLASLLGHLIASKEPYGDDLQRCRLSQARSPSAELIWQQLPPLTGATEAFTVAGMLEPTYDIGGDVFDYALSAHTVSVAIFDAVGHGLPAGLQASAALAGYRSARRDGRGVYDQARAIDDALAAAFPGGSFVTGVVGELDVASGRLRYINAGHPAPLLLRDGRVVRELGRGRRLPFGVETEGLTVAEEFLQPGDWLALYTDGVVEARNAAGNWFGEDRLVELLTHEMAAGQPPPETVRRLNRAVLEHQGGLLQDDASILLACWLRDR